MLLEGSDLVGSGRKWFNYLGTEEQEIVKKVPLKTLRRLDEMEDDQHGDNEERNAFLEDLFDAERFKAKGTKGKSASGGGSSGASGARSKNKRARLKPKDLPVSITVEYPIKYPDEKEGESDGLSQISMDLSDEDKILAHVHNSSF